MEKNKVLDKDDREVLEAVKLESDFTASSHDRFEPFSFERLSRLTEEGYLSNEGHSDAYGYWHFKITPKGTQALY